MTLHQNNLSQINSIRVDSSNAYPSEELNVEYEFLNKVLDRVAQSVTPVWPLSDYVAVNPISGLTDRPFIEARRLLRTISDIDTLMPLGYYRDLFRNKVIDRSHINAALDELVADRVRFVESLDVNTIQSTLMHDTATHDDSTAEEYCLPTIAREVDRIHGTDWQDTVINEISKHCAAYYDCGQAPWQAQLPSASLYSAWRQAAVVDRNLEILGLSGFRKSARRLPEDPVSAIWQLLDQLRVPQHAWLQFLRTHAFSMLGWSAWTRYCDSSAADDAKTHFISLLAIRLSYDVALSGQFHAAVDWSSFSQAHAFDRILNSAEREESTMIRFALLKASEIAFREKVISELDRSSHKKSPSQSKREPGLAQIAFCIDVRSERFRRNLEQLTDRIQTIGFAGFFGVPMEYLPWGEIHGTSQVPFIAKPGIQVHESFNQDAVPNDKAETLLARRRTKTSVRNFWKLFQSTVATTFSTVESVGLIYSGKLLLRSLGFSALNIQNPSEELSASKLVSSNLKEEASIELAESILRGMGLTENFSPFVLLCGHESQTENNPMQASLDCGACGGHSGAPNARFAAALLNSPAVRLGLVNRGIEIPQKTHFIAAVHNTTTDAITLLDSQGIPEDCHGAVTDLQAWLDQASIANADERAVTQPCSHPAKVLGASRDWSEVRPEWGLAGNAAFIAAPRELSQNANLSGRVFLHSYEQNSDTTGAILEQIMTAPMIVAHAINMQYYASTVCPSHFGNGSKTLHDVVGKFGVFSGSAGDLRIGLPWQSLHDGADYVHQPLRLLVILAASKANIDRILDRQPDVENLVRGGWIQLVALEDGAYFRCSKRRQWIELGEDLSFIHAEQLATGEQC